MYVDYLYSAKAYEYLKIEKLVTFFYKEAKIHLKVNVGGRCGMVHCVPKAIHVYSFVNQY